MRLDLAGGIHAQVTASARTNAWRSNGSARSSPGTSASSGPLGIFNPGKG